MDALIRFSSFQMTKAAPISNAHFRNLIQGLFGFLGNMASLVKMFPRIEAFEVNHTLGKFIFLGIQEKEMLMFLRHLDPDISDINPLLIGKWNLFSLPKQVTHSLNNGYDMVVFQVSPLYPFQFRTRYQLKTQVAVEQVLYLPDSVEEFLHGGKYREIRRLIYRAEREGITYQFSRKKEDFDLFYYQMYSKYVQERHGMFAVVNSYELLWEEFQQGGLLMLYKGDLEIAGSLVQSFGDFGIGSEGGVLEDRADIIPKKIYSLLVYFSLEWAIKQGIKRFDLGNSYAYRNNGVFRFKNSFVPVVEPQYRFNIPVRMILMDQLSKDLQAALNNAGLIIRHKNNFCGVLLSDIVDHYNDNTYSDDLKKSINDGLAGLVVVTPNQNKFIKA